MKFQIAILITIALSFGGVLAALAITAGQVDDFEDDTLMGWDEDPSSPNPPTNIPDGGPRGLGDNYLRNTSAGGAGPGSRMVMFNQTQWAGNYIAAGVDGIRVGFENAGTTAVTMRLAFQGGTSATRYATNDAFSIPPDRQWLEVEFDLGSLFLLQGTETSDQVLANVLELRILAAANPNWEGDAVAATLCVDNIMALGGGMPVELATWGRVKALYR